MCSLLKKRHLFAVCKQVGGIIRLNTLMLLCLSTWMEVDNAHVWCSGMRVGARPRVGLEVIQSLCCGWDNAHARQSLGTQEAAHIFCITPPIFSFPGLNSLISLKNTWIYKHQFTLLSFLISTASCLRSRSGESCKFPFPQRGIIIFNWFPRMAPELIKTFKNHRSRRRWLLALISDFKKT